MDPSQVPILKAVAPIALPAQTLPPQPITQIVSNSVTSSPSYLNTQPLQNTNVQSSLVVVPPQAVTPASANPLVPQQSRLSRREVLVGLTGIAAGGGLTLIVTTQGYRFHQLFDKKDVAPTSTPTIAPGTTIVTYSGHKGSIDFVVWSPDGSSILSGGEDASFKEWNAANGQGIGSWGFTDNKNRHTAGSWAQDGKHVVLGGDNSTVGILDLVKHKFLNQIVISGGETSLAWSPDSKAFAAGSNVDGITIYNVATSRSAHYSTPPLYDVPIYAIAWSPDGEYVAAGADDNNVYIWDTHTRNLHATYHYHTALVRTVAWSPDGKRLASGSDDGKVHIWEPNGEFTYLGHSAKVNAIAWSPDGNYIVSGSADKTLQVWDAENGNKILTYHEHTDGVTSVAWSPKGKHIASGSKDKTVKVWQVV